MFDKYEYRPYVLELYFLRKNQFNTLLIVKYYQYKEIIDKKNYPTSQQKSAFNCSRIIDEHFIDIHFKNKFPDDN